MKIPGLILKQMYTLGSLHNTEDGVRFSLKNRLSNAIKYSDPAKEKRWIWVGPRRSRASR